MKRRTEVLVLAAVVLLGAALRIAFLREAALAPDFTMPLIDAGFHDYWARALAFGQWPPPPDQESPDIQSSPYFRPPGYPYFLAGVYRLSGPGYLAPRIVQALLGLLSGLCAWLIARKISGPAAGLCTLFLMMVYWPFIYFESELHTPALQIFLTLAIIVILLIWAERGRRLVMLAGALLGLTALVRPEVMTFAPFAAVWIARASRLTGAKPWQAAGGFLLAFVLAIAPATARNLVAGNEFVLISANGGINLFLGNNEDATGFVAGEIKGFGAFRSCFDYPALKRSVERKVGRGLSDSEISRFFADRAVAYAISRPADVVLLTLKKALLTVSPHEYGHNKLIPFERANSRILSSLRIGFPFVFVLGLFGVFFSFRNPAPATGDDPAPDTRRRFAATLPLLFLAANWLSLLPFFVASRYRVPIIPLLIVFAGCALAHLLDLFHRGFKRRAAILSLVAAALIAAHQASPAVLPALRYEPNIGYWHYYRAVTLELKREYEEAKSVYRKALAAQPDLWEANLNLGGILLFQGRPEESLPHFAEAMRLQPQSPLGFRQYSLALVKLGRKAEAKQFLARARALQEAR